MNTQYRSHHRMRCANEQGGREWFALNRSDSGIRIDTPGALTRTHWTRAEAIHLRDTLNDLLDQPTNGRNGAR
ncbi:hypothetical protein [Haloactinomyces albus]|uniref:Uncharacterized protein n=1 Tax=Haloactinomyces albus TaxID=1352928 RepID=A0AAE4CQ31_9ACTN|nr:hypothetical protein [Haloactinomyces albus]MDR7302248.1 hypothetical protein [Haloactinomyces albus]